MAGRTAAGLDTSFLPGPEVLLPHLMDRSWQKSIDREEKFYMLGSRYAHRNSRTNPITWESPVQSARGSVSGRSQGGGAADIMSLEHPSRLGSACSTHLSSRRSVRTGSQYSARSGSAARGCSKNSRLHTAGSYVSAGSGRLSSILSAELDAERQQREAAEKEVIALRERLEEARKKMPPTPAGSKEPPKTPGSGSQVPGIGPKVARIQTPAATSMTVGGSS